MVAIEESRLISRVSKTPVHMMDPYRQQRTRTVSSKKHPSGLGGGVDCDQWDDLCLRQLFDPQFIDHLPVKEQVKYYKKRDLAHSKLYNMARQVWGDRYMGSRVRYIDADGGGSNPNSRINQSEKDPTAEYREQPPSNTLLLPDDHDFPDPTSSQFYQPRDRRPGAGALATATILKNVSDEIKAKQANDATHKVSPEEEEYRKWVKDRMQVRDALNKYDDLERWFATKPQVSPLEALVLKRFLEWKYGKDGGVGGKHKGPPVVRTPSSSNSAPPQIDRPLPVMVAVLEAYLQEHKLRLMDYFTMTDKNKNWLIGRNELRKAVEWTRLPVTDAELDDFLQYLDKEGIGALQYKHIAQTRTKFREKERRALLEKHGGQLSSVLGQKNRQRAEEREAARRRKLEEMRLRRNEASFIASYGDENLHRVNYGDPRKAIEAKKRMRKKTTGSSSSGVRTSGNQSAEESRGRTVETRPSMSAKSLASSKTVSLQRSSSATVPANPSSAPTGASRSKSGHARREVTWSARERSAVEVERFEELGQRRTDSILKSRSPSVPPPDSEDEDLDEEGFSPFNKSTSQTASRVGTAKSGRASTATTLLQTPEIDTNETIDFDPEMFFDKSKRLRFHLRHQKQLHRNPDLPPLEPLMIKCGDKEIDDHMTFSTRWDPLKVHQQTQNYRQKTWLQYEKCVELCKKYNIPLTEATLKRALLHPRDNRISRKDMPTRGEGGLFRREDLPHTKSQLRKIYPAGHPRFLEEEQEDEELELLTAARLADALAAFGERFKPNRAQDEDDEGNSTADSDIDSDDCYAKRPDRKNASNPAVLYPKHRHPRLKKEPLKLSTGRAFVGTQVDCWMTYKEFLKFSASFAREYRRYTGFSSDLPTWPGTEYKNRVPEDTTVRPSDTFFQAKPPANPQHKNKTTIYDQWK